MDILEAVEINRIEKALPFVTFYVEDTNGLLVWHGRMIAIPSKGDTVLIDDSSLEGTVKSITWAFIGESIFAQVFLKDVTYD